MMNINCIITNKKKDNCQRKHEQIAYEYEEMENINNIHVWKNESYYKRPGTKSIFRYNVYTCNSWKIATPKYLADWKKAKRLN